MVRPRGRIGHYVTLFERILKKTHNSSSDKQILPLVIQNLKEILNVCNDESGKSSNILKLIEYHQDLDTLANAPYLSELDVLNDKRMILRSNIIQLRRSTGDYEKYLILFDHILLITSRKKMNKRKIHRKVMICTHNSSFLFILQSMPLQLCTVSAEKQSTEASIAHQTKYVMVLNYKGRERIDYFIIFNTEADRKAWIQTIDKQKEKMTIDQGVYTKALQINVPRLEITCCAMYGNNLFIGTDEGLYRSHDGGDPELVFLLPRIAQLDIILESDVLLVLAGKGFFT